MFVEVRFKKVVHGGSSTELVKNSTYLKVGDSIVEAVGVSVKGEKGFVKEGVSKVSIPSRSSKEARCQ